MSRLFEEPLSLSDVWVRQRDWSDELLEGFNAQDCISKLREEVGELEANPCIEEAADVLLALLSWMCKSQQYPSDLLSAAQAKILVNWSRSWERRGNNLKHV